MDLQWPRIEDDDTLSDLARQIRDRALAALAKKAGVSVADLLKERVMTVDAVVPVLERYGCSVTRADED